MAKISRPIVYTALLGVLAYSYVVLTEPEARRKKPVARRTAASIAPEGFTEADLNARFPRYAGKGRDAFAPKVIAKKAEVGTLNPLGDAASGIWLLTGINLIDGVRSALLENARTGEAAFVRAGQRWNGMRVRAIEPSAVVFVNEGGKVTRMAFVDPEPDKLMGVAPVVVPPAVASAPTLIRPGAPAPLVIPAPVRNQP